MASRACWDSREDQGSQESREKLDSLEFVVRRACLASQELKETEETGVPQDHLLSSCQG